MISAREKGETTVHDTRPLTLRGIVFALALVAVLVTIWVVGLGFVLEAVARL
jgi:hypothetical protein